MKRYIDKDAVVAQIDDLLDDEFQCDSSDEATGFQNALTKIKGFINTLEVKEVDLEKYYIDFLQREWFGKPGSRTISEMMAFTAKHFFEFGLQMNNPITAADRGTAEEIIINLKRVEEDYHINLTKEIEWLRNQVKRTT